jgi:ADP-ribose pyrophosphatase YjhB (NUDIX family)
VTKITSVRFLEWAREIQALAQTGYHYAHDDFQRDRCRRLEEIAAEMIGEPNGIEPPVLATIFNSQAGYATPKIDVRAAVFRDGGLLMVRERLDGGWTMPGGWVDVGDTPSKAAERETWEEAGFQVKTRKLIGVYDANRARPLEIFHAFKLLFLCDILSGEARPSNETAEAGFFNQDQIPETLSGERTTTRHIKDAFAAFNDPDLPAVFD